MTANPVIGRFAPSPTGDLHFGSLVAAVGSFLEAKSAGGSWLLRIEDIDPPREVPGSADRIINDLERLGMSADAPVFYQSSRTHVYRDVVERLLAQGKAYPCACSRKDLPASGIYPGTCRNGIPAGRTARSVRLLVEDDECTFTDRVQGLVADLPASLTGDFIIRRADGLFAYQLAVVVDDEFQGVTQVVRGADLLESTSRQIYLQSVLGYRTPEYMHLPVALTTDGKKLGKRSHADPINLQNPELAVSMALHFLGHNPPPGCSLTTLWEWALEHWNSSLVPRRQSNLLTKV